jgi:hypothetical protein
VSISTEYQSIVSHKSEPSTAYFTFASAHLNQMVYAVWISGCLSLAPIVSAVDENELLDLDLDDLEDLADALGEPVLDFFLDFLGGFGMSGYGVAS